MTFARLALLVNEAASYALPANKQEVSSFELTRKQH
jgi:ATP-dependent Zn protease